MRRRGIRRGNRSGGSASRELAALEYYLARNLFSWMRADYRTEAGGKVTAFLDKVALVSEGAVAANARSVDPNHAFSQATSGNQVATPASGASWNSREVALFLGGQYYKSSLVSDWQILNNGSGAESIVAYAPTTTAAEYVFSNAAGTGAQWSQTKQSGNIAGASALTTSTATVFNNNAGSIPLNTPTYVDDWLLGTTGSATWSHSVKSTVAGSGTVTNAPSNSAPISAMTIGAAGNNGFPAHMEWADSMVASRVDSTLRAAQRRYLLLRYGLS